MVSARTFPVWPVLFAVLLAGCEEMLPVAVELPRAQCTLPGNAALTEPALESLEPHFSEAAAEFGIPAELLKAIGWVETRWQMVVGDPEFPGQPAAFGIMGLREGELERGAALAGSPPARVRSDPGENIRAAAALLGAHADRLGVNRGALGAWAPAVAAYSGISLPQGRSAYVHDDVFAVLRSGVDGDPRAAIAPRIVFPDFPAEVRAARSGAAAPVPDHPGAVWRTSPNHNARPAGDIGKVAMVVIHTCEGPYTGCWSWLANPDSRVSAHYVVREDGREITQLVPESGRAWHIGSTYDCSLNAGRQCWRNGHSNNHFTIGIEHAGYASQTFWPAAQLDASARLVCDLTRRHGIPRDAIHVLGHAQLQPHDRSDPGKNWPWAEFHRRLDAHCAGDAGEIVVDAVDAGNHAARARAERSAAWTLTRATRGHFGQGYYFASTGQQEDPAVFHFFLPTAATRTVDAWWTAGANRSRAVRFSATDPDGRVLGRATVDQQAGGSRWNPLGTWHFPAGWNSVEISRLGARGCVVIADAVRVR
jgi:N-acetyl-anhydromuramyl-L-alanine amidase AmpD